MVKKVCFYRFLITYIHISTIYCFCILSYRFAGLVMLFIIRWLRHTSFVLAAVDDNSVCVVWDVSQACILAQFSLGIKSVHDIQWLSTNVSLQSLLHVLCLFFQSSRYMTMGVVMPVFQPLLLPFTSLNWLGLPHFHTGYKVPHGVNLFCAHLENLLISSDIVTSMLRSPQNCRQY